MWLARLAGQPDTVTAGEFREDAIGDIKRAVSRLFPDLQLNTLGNPLDEGTFRFTKGTIEGFSYKNLSWGRNAWPIRGSKYS